MNIEETIQAVSLDFERFREERNIPGIAFGLMYKGDLIHATGIGERILGENSQPDVKSIFRIASMSKSFTARAILKLRDSGQLELHHSITIYLPWTSTIGNSSLANPITIWDLLTMGAGLPTDDPWGDRQESLPISNFDEMVSHGLTFNREPNTGFEYSNLSYALLGRIISVVSGQEYGKYMKQEILDPLGMSASTYLTGEISENHRASGYARFDSGLTLEPTTSHGAFTPMGGLHSSIEDLSKWVRSFRNNHLEEQTPHRFAQSWLAPASDGIPERIVSSSYGYGLFIDDDAQLGRFVHHSGGYPGFGSHMRWHDQSDFAIIALGNVTYAPMRLICTEIMNKLAFNHIQSNPAKANLTPASILAIEIATQLLNNWDNNLADRWFSENMDLDQPREERAAAIARMTAGQSNWQMVEGSILATTKSSAQWQVYCGESQLTIEVLMTPEKSQRIQKLSVTP